MDKEVLIAAVFNKIPIWDKRDKFHSNRNVIDKYWREISAEMKQDEAKVRKQWKYLRDQFSVELGKHHPPRSGDAAGNNAYTSKWPYFKQLILFLKDIVRPRSMAGNLARAQSTQETYEEETQLSVQCDENSGNEELPQGSEHEQESAVENCVTSPTSSKTILILPSRTAKKRLIDSYQASMLEIERRKVEYLESKAKRSESSGQADEHLLFFKSLLPHVKKIPESKILSFRCRVQELVDQFSYEPNISSRSSSSSQEQIMFQSHRANVPGTPNCTQNHIITDNNNTDLPFFFVG